MKSGHFLFPIAAIEVNASPPPTAQTSLRWREYAGAERMDEHASVFILRSFAKQNSISGR
jgi:hypothetical protein